VQRFAAPIVDLDMHDVGAVLEAKRDRLGPIDDDVRDQLGHNQTGRPRSAFVP
jgi:hypothetical protein